MGFGLVAEDVQQLRVERLFIGRRAGGNGRRGHFGLRRKLAHGLGSLYGDRGFRFWEALPLGQGVRLGGQVVDIVPLALGLGGEFVHQLRQQGDHVVDHALDVLVRLDAAVEYAVEQVLDGPGQLADDQRADHAAAALEGVEGTADFGQRVLVVRIGAPARQVVADGLQHFAGFFDEDFQQFVVHRLFVGRRRQQAGRDLASGRVDGLHRGGHDIGHGQRAGRFLDRGDNGLQRGGGQVDLRQVEAAQLHVVPAGGGFGQRLEAEGLVQHRFEGLGSRQRLEGLEVEGGEGLVGRLGLIEGFQFQRGVEAEVDDLGGLDLRLAEVPVVIGDQQRRRVIGLQLGGLEAVEGAQLKGFVQQRLGFQLGQRLQFGQCIEGHRLGAVQRFEFRQGIQCRGLFHRGGRLGEIGIERDFRLGRQGFEGQGLDRLGRFLGEDFDLLHRVGQRSGLFGLELREIEDGGLGLERVAQVLQALLGHVEDHVALGGVVLGEALQVVLDAGDGVGQGVQALPVGHGLAGQELFLDVAVAGFQKGSGAGQGDHRQAATDLGQQVGHAGQVLVVPLGGDELDDRVLGLFEAIARFLDHQLVDLRHVGGGQVALFAGAVIGRADHAGEGRLDVKQGAGDVHEDGVVGLALAEGQAVDDVDLVEDDPARLAKAEHGQGVGDLLEGREQGIQFGDAAAVAAHEDVEAVLDADQFLAKGGDHRAHGVAVGAGQAGTFLVHHVGVGQGLVETVLFLEGTDARRLGRGLGDVEQQVLDQFVRGRLVDAIGALVDQALELLVDLTQQGADGGAVDHAAIGQAFDHAGGDGPQGAQRGFLAQ